MNYIVLDIETTGLDPLKDTIHGVGVSYPDGRLEYHKGGPNAELQLWLKNPEANVVGHNLRFDLSFLEAKGFEIRCRDWDTKLLAQLLNENQELGLKPLSVKYFGASSLDNKKELDRAISSIKGRSVADLCKRDIESGYVEFNDVISEYCLEDCVNTRNLWDKLVADMKRYAENWGKAGLKTTPTQYYLEETMPLERVLRAMELKGIRVNLDALHRYREQLTAENNALMSNMLKVAGPAITEYEEQLYQAVVATKKSENGKANVQRHSEKYKTKFNWQSADHIATILFSKLNCPTDSVPRTATGKLSTSENTLDSLAKSLPAEHKAKLLLDSYAGWKKNLKLLTTYTGEDKGLLSQVSNNRIHSNYLQAGHGKESSQGGTVTGRLSSRKPNMQNLPRGSEIKRFFIPDPGHVFVYFDYSQLELRLAAHLSQDPLLMKAYREGLDLHQLTATAIGKDRQMGKTINFAMIYDASPWRLSSILDEPVEVCEEVIRNFYSLYPGYSAYLEREKKLMMSRGWVISETGRLRRLPELLTTRKYSKEWKHALKQGYNFPIQSLGASITKRGMIELHKRGYELVTQVHDSVVIQVQEHKAWDAMKEVVGVAESIYPCTVPIKVDAKILTSLNESDTIKEQKDEPTSNDNRQDSTSSTGSKKLG